MITLAFVILGVYYIYATTELAIETKKIAERRRRLNHAERILTELAYGYQSRNQYNKLIAKANGYFKQKELDK